jgi:hypothetical protein
MGLCQASCISELVHIWMSVRANICEGYGDIRLVPNRTNTWRMIKMISLKQRLNILVAIGFYWAAYHRPSVAGR